MSDREAFLAKIREQPGNDLARLVFADWLEENGDADYAEFIRLQCALDSGSIRDPAEMRAATDREGHLAEQNIATWFDDAIPTINREWFDDPDSFGDVSSQTPVYLIRRGFPAEVRAPAAWLFGGACDRCGDPRTNLEDRHEFGSCPHCHGDGRTPGNLPGLVAKWPLETVVATSRTAGAGWDASWQRYWHDGGPGCGDVANSASLPSDLWRRLEGGFIENVVFRVYDDDAAALAALSAAALSFAKDHA